MKPNAWTLWLVVGLLGTVGTLVVSRGWAEETHKVKEKPGEVSNEVPKKYLIDHPGKEEPVSPESVTKVGDTITIVSKTFKPPGPAAPPEWCFKDFATHIPWKHVDIETDPASLPATVNPDETTEIKITVANVPETAAMYPLKGEGNLKDLRPKGSGGGGGKDVWYWSAKVSREKAYYFLWGWMDKSPQRIAPGVTAIQPVVDKLKAMGYEVYDDGPAFNQAEIDKAFTDDEIKAHPLRVIIDRNTTTANLTTYLQRQTARGLLWAGHGFMEPYPGCPDDDLLKFESRVWTAKAGDPTKSGDRIFVRDLQPLITGKQEHPMNFLVLAQCDTGGFDAADLADPWHWVNDATKDRVIAIPKYGGVLPPSSHPDFKFKSFDVLAGSASFFKIYVGNGSWIYDGELDINALSDSVKD